MATAESRDRVTANTPSERPTPANPEASDQVSPLVTWHSRAFGWVEKQGWLRDLDERLSAWIQPLHDRYQDNVIVELMHGGRWAGHPLHPALSDLPVGLWIGSVLMDAAEASSRDGRSPGRMDAAGALSAAGIAGGVATFITGIDDWTVSDHDDRRIGLFHGLLNSVGLALQGGSLGARLAGYRGSARVLGAASLAVTVGAAYVGGHLVFHRGVMVNRVAWSTGPARWTRALPDADLEDGASVEVEVEGRHVMLRRENGTIYALDNLCNHAGGSLHRGAVDDGIVTCPLHGARFDIGDGRVIRGPAHQPQPALPTRVRKDWIEVRGTWPQPRRRKSET